MASTHRLLFLAACLSLAGAPQAWCGPHARKEASGPKAKESPGTDRYGDPLPAGAVARLGTVRLRHNGALAISFSQDGKRLISAWAGAIRFWDATTGQELQHFDLPRCSYDLIALSADAKTAALCDGETIAIWDLRAAKELHRLRNAHPYVPSIAFSPDGRLLASRNNQDATACLWDVSTGTRIHRLGKADSENGNWLRASIAWNLAFSPEGTVLGSAGKRGEVSLWLARSGKLLLHRREKAGRVNALAFSPDGKLLAWGGEDRVQLWDLTRQREVRRLDCRGDSISHLAFSPDSKRLAAGHKRLWGLKGAIRVWDVGRGKESWHTGELPLPVSSVAFSPDGTVLAAGVGSAIRQYLAATGKERASLPGHSGAVRATVFLRDGQALASAGDDDDLCFWDLSTGNRLRTFADGQCDDLDLSRDGRLLASGSGTITFRAAGTGQEVGRLRGRDDLAISSFRFAADDRSLLTFDSGETLRTWDVGSGKELRQRSMRDLRERANPAIFSADGRTLALVYRTQQPEALLRPEGREVCLYDVPSGRELSSFAVGQEDLPGIALSMDGKALAFGLRNGVAEPGGGARGRQRRGVLSLREVATGQERCRLSGLDGETLCIAFGPEGRTLAVAGDESVIRVWDVASGRTTCRFRGHQGPVYALRFTSDGQRLASASGDTTVLVWDLAGAHARATQPPPERVSPERLERFWHALAERDAAVAWQAMTALVASPAQAVAFLGQHLRPVSGPDSARVARLIADLDHDRFAIRDKAMQELQRYGELVEPALRSALAREPTLEARRRLSGLLDALGHRKWPLHDLRVLRSIEALEHIDRRDARQLLQALTKGTAEAWLTHEAKASLRRLARRAVHRP
ncbi:MAG TPA: WD40 repeat domain-containing protein [Gemmataceae bacterium]|nr:WD40 repeat domain-containing protein [Gemmataceae bacterium]